MENKYKVQVQKEIEAIEEKLFALSDYIFENPEFGFKEFKAHKVLVDCLTEYGFSVDSRAGGLETAFKATYGCGRPGPHIGVFCEYDAVKPKGHCCGHNLMAAMGVGAGIALRPVVEALGGKVSVLGTPAEEGGGGKILMLREGVFDDLDVGLLIHPANETVVNDLSYSVTDIVVEFYGVKAHAATYPEDGISALSPLLQLFGTVAEWRQRLNGRAYILGVIEDGGESPIYVPDYTRGHFTIRSFDTALKNALVERFLSICQHMADSTETTFKYSFSRLSYEAIQNNPAIEALLKANFEALGESVKTRDTILGIGCTDMGNVTHALPALQSYVKLDDDLMAHSDALMAAASDARGRRTLLKGAKAMAMTAVDLFDSAHLKAVKAAFERQKQRYK